MSKLIIRGGYGEHGRSCFLVEYGEEGHMYMVDCGILDTDRSPFPNASKEELERVDYLFMTHCHKDHSGAFEYFCQHGFRGTLVASAMTVKLAGIDYEKTEFLELEGNIPASSECRSPRYHSRIFGPLTAIFGRSGHCPGAVWFEIHDGETCFFFSGDYQEDADLYICDPVRERKADIAIIDCAHRQTKADAKTLRADLILAVRKQIENGGWVIFPVPQFGRGLEIYCMLKENFPGIRICVDSDFKRCAEKMLSDPVWFYEEPYRKWLSEKMSVFGTGQKRGKTVTFDVLLIADTHLKKRENLDFVRASFEKGAAVFVTGRVKEDGPVHRLLQEGKAEKYLFPHHQSNGDLERMAGDNKFLTILPFHNNEKEILISPDRK